MMLGDATILASPGEEIPDDVTPAFLAKLDELPRGYSEGLFDGRRYGTTVKQSSDGRRLTFYAEELRGGDHISFNLFETSSAAILKPCEMQRRKVIDFVLGYITDCEKPAYEQTP